MAWRIPSGLAVTLALATTAYVPPIGTAVALPLDRVGEAVHRSAYAVQVAVAHQTRHGMLVGEEPVSGDHLARHAVLTGEEAVTARHIAEHEIRVGAAANHLGRYRLLQGGFVIDADHGGQWGITLGLCHAGRHHHLALEAETAADHRTFHGIALAVEHQNIYPEKVVATRKGRWTLMGREYPVAFGHLTRHAMLTGEAAVPTAHLASHSIRFMVAHQANHAVLYPVRKRHLGLWDVVFPLGVEHRCDHALLLGEPVAAGHAASWSLQTGGDHLGVWQPLAVTVANHAGSWGGLPSVATGHVALWAAMVQTCARHEGSWSGMPVVQADHLGVWPPLALVRVEHLAAFRLTVNAHSRHSGDCAMLPRDPARADHRADYALHSGEVRIVTDQPRLIHDGRTLALRAAEIRADDGSFTWLARIELVRVEEWLRIRVGDAISLDLYGEVFNLVVDEKEMSRENAGIGMSLTLLAVSPLGLRRERVSRSWTGPVDARQAVEDLLGPVTWQLPDWTIPAGRLAAERADPVSLARQITNAAGGVVESLPDGSILCRPRFPLAVPDWPTATPDHLVTDDETLAASESYAPVELADRIAIADGDQESGQDEVEFLADEGNPNQGTLRVYPAPWREVSVVHTGDDQVSLSSLGEQERGESELVQIQAGRGRTRYPVTGIVTTSWQYANLGAISFTADSRKITSALPEYSLLRLTYRTRCLAWTAADVRDEEILFLVTD